MASEIGHSHGEFFNSGYLQVSDLHRLHYAQSGNPDGKPVIFIHGGPGGIGVATKNTVFFDPAIYNVVLFDQRGAGKSEPSTETRENTTQLLIEDIEKLRKHFGVRKWHMVFGGSWGSTLSLAYAQAHPEVAGSLVLRGVFLGTKEELDLGLKGTLTGKVWPEAFDRYIAFLPENKRDDPLKAYHELIMSDDLAVASEAAREWNRYELSTVQLKPDEAVYDALEDDRYNMAHAKMETHYFVNNCFLEPDQLLKGCEKIRHIPTSIVQGRYDALCPPRAAWDIHKALPGSKLFWSGFSHSPFEGDNRKYLVQVCDEYAKSDFHLQ